MRLYILVEGNCTEKQIYKGWLSSRFPALVFATSPEEVLVHDEAAFIISGNGYPSYVNRIAQSQQDLRRYNFFDWFIIIVDSEEYSVAEKQSEIVAALEGGIPFPRTRVVVQYRCIETWLLANSKMIKAIPESPELRLFADFYDVRNDDPEALPIHPKYRNHAQTHHEYLRAAFRERRLTYNKKSPAHASGAAYMQELMKRHNETSHISSFGALVRLFDDLERASRESKEESSRVEDVNEVG